jgi:hypothetical protein
MQRTTIVWAPVLAILIAPFATGCGSPAPTPTAKKDDAKKAAAKAADGPLEVSVDDLPSVVDPLALKEPPVVVRKPQDWFRAPKGDYLVRFYQKDGKPFPHVNITAAKTDLPDGDMDKLMAAVKSDTSQLKPASIVAPPRIAKLGDKQGVYDIRKANIQGTVVERIVFNLVHGGWRYHVELRSLPSNSTEYEPLLQAVAAHLEFKAAAEAVEPKVE